MLLRDDLIIYVRSISNPDLIQTSQNNSAGFTTQHNTVTALLMAGLAPRGDELRNLSLTQVKTQLQP